jgi:NAD(P)-dependent dehydrogenase (short-subunit alcohol dehydrogenase family)
VTPPSPEPRQVAVVTGASQGIGEGIAAAFLQAGRAVVAPKCGIRPRAELVAQSDRLGDSRGGERFSALVSRSPSLNRSRGGRCDYVAPAIPLQGLWWRRPIR